MSLLRVCAETRIPVETYLATGGRGPVPEAHWKARPAQDSQGLQAAQIGSNWGQRRTDLAKEQISISYLINSKALPTPLRIQSPHGAYQA